MTVNVLVLCTHNAARSVLAEAMLNHWAGKLDRDVRAFSAGSHPAAQVHGAALAVLGDAGIDTAALRAKSWDEFATPGAPHLSIVITVCDDAAGEACPVFFGGDAQPASAPARIHWGYPDPSHSGGGGGASDAGVRQAFELTRLAIGYRMLRMLALPLATMDRADLQSALADIGRC